MMSKDTGGPAFPHQEYTDSIDPRDINPVTHHGMTLRDYFAIHALQGAMTRESFADGFNFHEKADWVYDMADAMLKAR